MYDCANQKERGEEISCSASKLIFSIGQLPLEACGTVRCPAGKGTQVQTHIAVLSCQKKAFFTALLV